MPNKSFAVIITSIASPNKVIKDIAEVCKNDSSKKFYVIGDTKSPKDFSQEGCDFYSVDRQLELGFDLAKDLPTRHYARKNLGYLQAWKDGFEIIVETDDDNFPLSEFWADRSAEVSADFVQKDGWVNVYKLFSKQNIWPRGLPLEHLHASNEMQVISGGKLHCPIQQGLADENPDVDAVYRMILELPFNFDKREPVVLRKGAWCPFNSQNTTWFKEAYPLMYLPSYCSFRMTDIWRSFIAQRIAWTNGWEMLFHNATVIQDRNEHSLLKDFDDEVPGYLQNNKIALALAELKLKEGIAHIYDNLLACYEMMLEKKFISDERELLLVKSWI
ncbi:MAG: DUF288 domain-containing protein, partial [Bacteroidetes bacterium]|nr:DUF288 domain-containing protein [Bacteroidota bacterium]